jgi:2'-5' RNA ligase
MAFAVVAFPVLADADGRFIEDLRRKHDPNAARIGAHVTLVFPTAEASADVLARRVEAVTAKTAPIAFELRRVMVHHEPPDAYVYLVPDRGYETLIGLHGQLNAPAKKPARKFVPHVTVARLQDRQAARSLATALATRHIAIGGAIRALNLVEVGDTGPIRTVQTMKLRG